MVRYFDILSGRMPALERGIIKLRCYKIVLSIHYAEEIKSIIVDAAVSSKQWAGIFTGDQKAIKKMGIKDALEFLIDKEIITHSQSADINKITEFRNGLAHEIHNIFADMSEIPLDLEDDPFDNSMFCLSERYFNKIHEILRNGGLLVASLPFNDLVMGRSARVLRDEMINLENKLIKLNNKRKETVQKINYQLNGLRKLYQKLNEPPMLKNSQGKITNTGVDFIKIATDSGYMPEAIAFFIGVSLNSIKRRIAEVRQ